MQRAGWACGSWGRTLVLHCLVLVEEMGQTYLAESDADADEARTLRPLQAAAVTPGRPPVVPTRSPSGFAQTV